LSRLSLLLREEDAVGAVAGQALFPEVQVAGAEGGDAAV
jgi:hypothetical protein